MMELVYAKEKSLFAIMMVLASLVWLVLIVCTLGIALLYVLMGFLVYLVTQSAFISYLRGTAVHVTAEQLPQLHQRIQHCAHKLQIRDVPDAFVLQADGMLNALATKFLGRRYIVLFSSVLDALEDHPEAIDFYIGHELGHLRRNHLNWSPFLMIVGWIPFLGAAYRRAQEYTCDRHGLACCDNPLDAQRAIATLAAGGSYRQVDVRRYSGQIDWSRGFWMSFHELVSSYPWLTKRMYAVQELSAGREPVMPGRNPMAFVLALFVPNAGTGAAGSLILVAMIGIMAAVALPAYHQYQQRAAERSLGLSHEELGVDDAAAEHLVTTVENDAASDLAHAEKQADEARAALEAIQKEIATRQPSAKE
ncbi:peptidase M48 [Jeongeupia chitinilytica]|uniref:Peptidase M48 n=2 Tax=Jeongeupia chitinilytica TaxID=1041641 RepID=A0ABQ3H5X1_9NEIS|nr:peptidase M48 [Jeongeupia chitinilytica]